MRMPGGLEHSSRGPDGSIQYGKRDREHSKKQPGKWIAVGCCVRRVSASSPAKLVKCILTGEYTDVAELLRDNVEAERRRASENGGSQVPYSGRRELPDFEGWLQCFSSYALQWSITCTAIRL